MYLKYVSHFKIDAIMTLNTQKGSKWLCLFSNAAPYHVVTQTSVDEINKKIPDLKEPVPALNFRLCYPLKGNIRECRHFCFQAQCCCENSQSKTLPRGQVAQAEARRGCARILSS